MHLFAQNNSHLGQHSTGRAWAGSSVENIELNPPCFFLLAKHLPDYQVPNMDHCRTAVRSLGRYRNLMTKMAEHSSRGRPKVLSRSLPILGWAPMTTPPRQKLHGTPQPCSRVCQRHQRIIFALKKQPADMPLHCTKRGRPKTDGGQTWMASCSEARWRVVCDGTRGGPSCRALGKSRGAAYTCRTLGRGPGVPLSLGLPSGACLCLPTGRGGWVL